MEPREPGQRGKSLVDPWVVFHGARAERIEARVDTEVARRELREMADELELRHLGQTRRLAAAEVFRELGLWEVLVARQRRGAPAGLRLLVDELHATTSASTSASRSIS